MTIKAPVARLSVYGAARKSCASFALVLRVVGISEAEQRYDRLVVYSTISKESFSTDELIPLFVEYM
ncbi:hypothetical protein SAMN05660964_02462 [Thiothrix caldifontis]|uniref:Uncharacterized protein n=1 Tax=Thiothrix caldifontis TaxID=525918 RepID=A0A1H4E5C4_9GAMM|nr:hypothetical protein [Thiothrix caldifontis]SEA80037.1 hypothetical protein SAMN05660964_02462 [Thiothrix caldifontis]